MNRDHVTCKLSIGGKKAQSEKLIAQIAKSKYSHFLVY